MHVTDRGGLTGTGLMPRGVTKDILAAGFSARLHGSPCDGGARQPTGALYLERLIGDFRRRPRHSGARIDKRTDELCRRFGLPWATVAGNRGTPNNSAPAPESHIIEPFPLVGASSPALPPLESINSTLTNNFA